MLSSPTRTELPLPRVPQLKVLNDLSIVSNSACLVLIEHSMSAWMELCPPKTFPEIANSGLHWATGHIPFSLGHVILGRAFYLSRDSVLKPLSLSVFHIAFETVTHTSEHSYSYKHI